MEYDKGKVDEVVLALLYLTMFKDGPGWRAWKGQELGRDGSVVCDGVHFRPEGRAKSVVLTEKGAKLARRVI